MACTLRDRASRAAQKVREWTADRDAAVVEMREDGARLREIAETTGLSLAVVTRILDRQRRMKLSHAVRRAW